MEQRRRTGAALLAPIGDLIPGDDRPGGSRQKPVPFSFDCLPA
jgi:hypothetical protein